MPLSSIKLKSELFTDFYETTEIDKNVYLVPAIYVDEKPLVDFRVYATFVKELQESMRQSGAFFIITCWCGSPWCAGINHRIGVLHDAGTIKWKMVEPEQRDLVFDAYQYQQAVENGIHQIRRDIADLRDLKGKDEEDLIIVPGWPEDMEILEIKERPKGIKRKHKQSY